MSHDSHRFDRRTFLKSTVALGTAATLAAAPLVRAQGAPKTLKFGHLLPHLLTGEGGYFRSRPSEGCKFKLHPFRPACVRRRPLKSRPPTPPSGGVNAARTTNRPPPLYNSLFIPR